MTAIDEANLESMLLEERTKYLSSGPSTDDKCIFVLVFNIASIALLDSKDISIRPTKLSLQILVDSVEQPMFRAHLSLFCDCLF